MPKEKAKKPKTGKKTTPKKPEQGILPGVGPPPKRQFRTVGADDEILAVLTERRLEIEARTGRRISLAETLRYVLGLRK